jgi:hypothetical protein
MGDLKMQRHPVLMAILAASAIAFASTSTAKAQDECAVPVDQPATSMHESTSDTTCPVPDREPAQSDDRGMTNDGQSGESGLSGDQGATRSGQSGADGPKDADAMASEKLGQYDTDDQRVQVADKGAAD